MKFKFLMLTNWYNYIMGQQASESLSVLVIVEHSIHVNDVIPLGFLKVIESLS